MVKKNLKHNVCKLRSNNYQSLKPKKSQKVISNFHEM